MNLSRKNLKSVKSKGIFHIEIINNIRSADDAVIIADSEEKLQALLDTVERESENMGLKINIKKTEVVVTSKNPEPPNYNI